MNPMVNMELQRRSEVPVASNSRQPVRASTADDKAMLKAAADLTRHLNQARPSIYWADLIGSAVLGYAGLFTFTVPREQSL